MTPRNDFETTTTKKSNIKISDTKQKTRIPRQELQKQEIIINNKSYKPRNAAQDTYRDKNPRQTDTIFLMRTPFRNHDKNPSTLTPNSIEDMF